MQDLPHLTAPLVLLKWIAANPNKPFDPNLVVSLSTGHSSDWEWQAVLSQMESLRLNGYVNKMKQDGGGSTYWTISESGEHHLRALEIFEQARQVAQLYPEAVTPKQGGTNLAVIGGWEELKELGEGGQSKVYLVRSPMRLQARRNAHQMILANNPWSPYAGGNPNEQAERIERMTAGLAEFSRRDEPAELGALKKFKIDENEEDAALAIGRLKNEIAVLKKNKPGLIKLLDSNETEKWIVTEYMPGGAMDKSPKAYEGDAVGALTAFRSLVTTVAGLHQEDYVHRDIKPANVFIASKRNLVLGDFGIVFVPDQRERLTVTNERVGPRDYMPQWADLGERLDNVHTNFDVYMLGKLLWCMVTGKLKLPREYHYKVAYDVKVLFPKDPSMIAVDAIVKRCVVEEPEDCPASAIELLPLVEEQLQIAEELHHGGDILVNGIPERCRLCRKGHYHKTELDDGVTGRPVVVLPMAGMPIEVSMFVCDNCRHVLLFREAKE